MVLFIITFYKKKNNNNNKHMTLKVIASTVLGGCDNLV